MQKESAIKLIDAIAQLNRPLGNVCEKALDSIENDLENQKIKSATDLLLKGHYELIKCIQQFQPELDPNGDGADIFEQMLDKYK